MFYALKTLISALIIVLVGETAKRSSTLAALLLSLPIISVVSFVWLYAETNDKVKIADLSYETFWFVLPTLPMFLLLSYLLRRDFNFYLALGICAVLTAVLSAVMQTLMAKLA
jgi:hypothetical protein